MNKKSLIKDLIGILVLSSIFNLINLATGFTIDKYISITILTAIMWVISIRLFN